MGQQQLLLVILVTIIVGIATVVAINTFGAAADQANLDSVRNDVAAIASSAQGFYMKPTMLGGGGRTFTGIGFQGFGFAANGIEDDNPATIAQNENGRYVIDASDAQLLIVTAHPASGDNYAPAAVAGGVLGAGGVDAAETSRITARVCANGMDIATIGTTTYTTLNCE
jgi:hypothetical protein